jgi:putative CocE/NonD family hydrolase
MGVQVVKDVRIPMRDGVRLAGDLYLPTGGATLDRPPLPVVLDYIPYRKDDVPPGSRFYEALVMRGYVVARVDTRGTGASQGVAVDEYTLEEQLDGCDTVEWLAAQPFCDGHVNMMGISYGGFTALQVATHDPEHLTSIVPIDFTHDRYTDDCHYRGGLLRMYYDPGFYGSAMVARNAMPPSPDSGEDWARTWEEHLAGGEPYLLRWLRHQTDGPYWRNGSVGDAAERIRCPVFMIGGWRDGYPNPPFELHSRLTVPHKILVGPWNHALPDEAVPGPRIDYVREVARWLDHWCKGEDTGIMDEPPVIVFEQHWDRPLVSRTDTTGVWRGETAWPPPGASELVLHLGEGGKLSEETGSDGRDSFAYVPTVGVCGGLWSGGVPFGLPGDQRPDEALSITYTTEPLDQNVHVLGRPRAELHVDSTATVVGFCVSIADVSPDGESHLVAKGMLNATRRMSLTDPMPLEPGELAALDIPIDATAWRFDAGHRIRVAIASADFPNVWPTPEPAQNGIRRGPARPSHVVLPVVPSGGSADPPEFAPASKRVDSFSSLPHPPTWEIVQDAFTGSTTVRVKLSTESRIDEQTVVVEDFLMIDHVDPSNPAAASAHGKHRIRIARPNHVTEARSTVTIQGSATHFHVTISLEVTVNEAPYLTKHWTESIRRQLL